MSNINGKTYYNTKGKVLGSRHVEYENINKAAAEIIDNSIEANASFVYIFLEARHDDISGKTITSKIAFLDDGQGMSSEELQEYVRDGSSSKADNGTMGKFGVGLNQASLFASPKFEVFSWINKSEVFYQSIDSREMRINNEYRIMESVKTSFPTKYKIDNMPKNHGTLVIWTELEKDNQFRPATVAERMNQELGRIFRYYINTGKIKIYLSAEFQTPILCEARDPMFLIENDFFLGDPNGSTKKTLNGECLFEPFSIDGFENGVKIIDVPYFDEDKNIKNSFVTISASIIKEKFYYKAAFKDGFQRPGDTEIGKHLKKMANGITILRGNREIDFNYFDYYDSINQPNDRWFKIQISFNRELDDIFGVSNNKQHIELKSVDEGSFLALDITSPYYPIWLRLKKDIVSLVSAMRKRNSILASTKIDVFSDFLNSKNDSTLANNNTDLNNVKKNNKDDNSSKVKSYEPINPIINDVFKLDLIDRSIIIYYDDLSNGKIYNYYFDKEIRKFIITFDNKICKGKFDSKAEFMVSLLIRELSKQPSNSETQMILLDLLAAFETNLRKIRKGE